MVGLRYLKKEKYKYGDFIRTNDGIIGQVKRIELDDVDKSLKWYVFDGKRPDMGIIYELYINKPYIEKYSKDIIDLIEVGDIVFIEDFSGYDFIYINDKEMLEALKQDVKDGVRIKSILTKELYQANCYTVERKEKC